VGVEPPAFQDVNFLAMVTSPNFLLMLVDSRLPQEGNYLGPFRRIADDMRVVHLLKSAFIP